LSTTAPLGGVRVIDLGTGIAGPYCTKLLADAGAEVLKIEPPGGDPLRRWTASGAALAPGEDGALFRFLNTSKRSADVDLATAAGREQTLALACDADLVIDGWTPALLSGTGLDPHAALARNPRLSWVSVTPFGRSGPWSARPATEFTLQAWCGSTASRGAADRPPLAAAGRLGEFLGGAYAAAAALTALHASRAGGRGVLIDLSLLEVMALTMAPNLTVWESLAGQKAPFRRTVEIPSIEPAHDGFVGFCTITGQQWKDFLLLIERPDLVDDERLARWDERQRRVDEVNALIHAWTRRHAVAEIVERAVALRIPVAAIGTGETVTTFDHFVTRGVFVPHPGAGFVQPRPPYRLSDASLAPLAPAPRLREHEPAWQAPRRQTRETRAVDPERPLAGLRVIDFTAFWAGPFVTHYLAAMGADVIKVESIQRPDGMRFQSVKQPAHDGWWEWSALFHQVNLDKRGITLDLTRPEGRTLVERLLARSDVAVENFSPRVLDGLGLVYERLARDNPGLILVRMPAFGLDGPWRDRVGFAQTMEQVSGMAWLTGFADGPPVIPRGPCDPLAGLHAIVALLVALEHRARTGRGQLVEATMVEAALNAAAEIVLEHGAYGALLARDGNRGPALSLQNLYPCRGEDEWLAVSLVDERHWQALVDTIGAPAWTQDPALADARSRRARQDVVDDGIAAWTRSRDAHEAAEALLARGVPAAPVVSAADVGDNPQLRARGFFAGVSHPVVGTHEFPAVPLRFGAQATPRPPAPAPTLGEHNAEVLRDLLGMSDDEIARLRAIGVIGERPLGL
jgi:crotonobetainyl-CoA:carnitine CoA-transferase CaiB-like acyl-CoA transferase